MTAACPGDCSESFHRTALLYMTHLFLPWSCEFIPGPKVFKPALRPRCFRIIYKQDLRTQRDPDQLLVMTTLDVPSLHVLLFGQTVCFPRLLSRLSGFIILRQTSNWWSRLAAGPTRLTETMQLPVEIDWSHSRRGCFSYTSKGCYWSLIGHRDVKFARALFLINDIFTSNERAKGSSWNKHVIR